MLHISLEEVEYERLPEESLLELSLEIQEANEELFLEEAKHVMLNNVTHNLNSIDITNTIIAREQLNSVLSYIGQEHLTDVVIANEGLGRLISRASKGIADTLKAIWDAIVKLISKIYNWIKKAIRKLFGKDDSSGGGGGGGGSSYTETTAKETNEKRKEEEEKEKARIEEIRKMNEKRKEEIDREISEFIEENKKEIEEKRKIVKARKEFISGLVNDFTSRIISIGIRLPIALVSPDYIGPNNYSLLKSIYALKEKIEDTEDIDKIDYETIYRSCLSDFFDIREDEVKDYYVFTDNINNITKFTNALYMLSIGFERFHTDKEKVSKDDIIKALKASNHLYANFYINEFIETENIYLVKIKTDTTRGLIDDFIYEVSRELKNINLDSDPNKEEINKICNNVLFGILKKNYNIGNHIKKGNVLSVTFIKDDTDFINNLISDSDKVIKYESKISGKAVELRLKDLKNEIDRLEKERNEAHAKLVKIKKIAFFDNNEVSDDFLYSKDLVGRKVYIRCELYGNETVETCFNNSKLKSLLTDKTYSYYANNANFFLYTFKKDASGVVIERRVNEIIVTDGGSVELDLDYDYLDEYENDIEELKNIGEDEIAISGKFSTLYNDLEKLKTIFNTYANSIKEIIKADAKLRGSRELDDRSIGDIINSIEPNDEK